MDRTRLNDKGAEKTSSKKNDKARENKWLQWLRKIYLENWSAQMAADAFCKIIEGKSKTLDSEWSLCYRG